MPADGAVVLLGVRAVAETSLTDLSLADFLARLASTQPTPGGGSVAALTGALAASLGRMVAGFTLGRPKFAAVEPQVRGLAERLTRAAELFARLIDEDAAAYELLSGALKMDKSDPARAERVRQAAGVAARVPLETAALGAAAWADLEQLHAVGNPRLHSDAQAAMHLARAAVLAAAANVRANLSFLHAEDRAEVGRQLEHFIARVTD